ncbi:MAG: hypothetical protein PHT94_01195 [Candidatus Nanoarchaeia archaeon]|nr:hypothetical protein [Candidatus Nanoarchaeia archaeon]
MNIDNNKNNKDNKVNIIKRRNNKNKNIFFFSFILIIFTFFFLNIDFVLSFQSSPRLYEEIQTGLIAGWFGNDYDDSFPHLKTFDPFVPDVSNLEYNYLKNDIENSNNIFNRPYGLFIFNSSEFLNSFCLDNRFLIKRGIIDEEKGRQIVFDNSSTAYKIYDCSEYGSCSEGKCVVDILKQYKSNNKIDNNFLIKFNNFFDVLIIKTIIKEGKETKIEEYEKTNLNDKQNKLEYYKTDFNNLLDFFIKRNNIYMQEKGNMERVKMEKELYDANYYYFYSNYFLQGNLYKYDSKGDMFELLNRDYCLDSETLVERIYLQEVDKFVTKEVKCSDVATKFNSDIINSNGQKIINLKNVETNYCFEGRCVDDDFSQYVCEGLGYEWEKDQNINNNNNYYYQINQDNCNDFYLTPEKGLFEDPDEILKALDPLIKTKKVLYLTKDNVENFFNTIVKASHGSLVNFFLGDKEENNEKSYGFFPLKEEIKEENLDKDGKYYYDEQLSYCIDESFLLKKFILDGKLFGKIFDCSEFGECFDGKCVVDFTKRKISTFNNLLYFFPNYAKSLKNNKGNKIDTLVKTDSNDIYKLLNEKNYYGTNFYQKGVIYKLEDDKSSQVDYDKCENEKNDDDVVIKLISRESYINNLGLTTNSLFDFKTKTKNLIILTSDNPDNNIKIYGYDGIFCYDGQMVDPDEKKEYCKKYSEIFNVKTEWNESQKHTYTQRTMKINNEACIGDDSNEREDCKIESIKDINNNGYVGCLDEDCWETESECTKHFETHDYLINEKYMIIKKVNENGDTNYLQFLNYNPSNLLNGK